MRITRILLVVIILALAISALAQTATTSLRGTVMDPKGAVIPGAKVTLANSSVNFKRETTSDGQGQYQFQQVPPGTYDVTAEASNVGKITQKNVQLLVSQPSVLNLAVKITGGDTTVEVSGTAAALNTTDATIGNAFNTQQILTLPFEGRNPVEILSLQPGVAYTGPSGVGGNSIDKNFDSRNGSVNGGRSDQTNIVLDGVDNNDQNNGYAFSGALRSTLDSVQEFRVTTTNSNADAGRSSGAQVTLVTKSGTNTFHGALYEYNRSGIGVANDWFNKNSQLGSNQPNRPGKLVRNTYGASLGGPVLKDRIFFFGTFEAQRNRESTQVTRVVPTKSLKQGNVNYITCDLALTGNADCTGLPTSVFTLTPADVVTMDPNCSGAGTCPLGPGESPITLAVLQGYPDPNTNSCVGGDNLNLGCFTFAAPTPSDLNTYIAKIDFNITQNGNHKVFLRGNFQDDSELKPSQFPNLPANTTIATRSKGLAAGYTAILSNSLINSFRYGYARQAVSQNGIGNGDYLDLRSFDTPAGNENHSLTTAVPVHSFVDDLTWTKGKHTLQFGGNIRIVNDIRASTLSSFNFFQTNASFLGAAGIADTGTSLDPGAFGFPAVSNDFAPSYDDPIAAITGLVPEGDNQFNFDIKGNALPEGSPTQRHFLGHEYEFYAQDSWRIRPNLTITGGLRWTLLQPPYEKNGVQVAPTISLEDWFNQRGQTMNAGQPFSVPLTFDVSGQANGKKPYWGWSYGNVAPRVAIAYSPGFWKKLFGEDKTSIRAGYGIYYDHFGEGIVNEFDRDGSFGLSTTLSNTAGGTPDSVARISNYNMMPASLVQSPPPAGFPVAYPPSAFNVSWGLSDKIKTPYSHAIDLSVERELPGGFVGEVAYVGRFARHLLQQDDLAMPRDIRDPASGTDYFTAIQALDQLAIQNGGAGVDESTVAPIPYWENLFGATAAGPGGAAGCAVGSGGVANPTATQNVYDLLTCGLVNNETTLLQIIDGVGGSPCFPGCITLGGVTGPDQFFPPGFASLYAWRSIGTSSYNAGQFMLRHPMKHGFQFDFNYVYSKSIDIGSDAERIGFLAGPGNQLFNAWNPKAQLAVSDYDTTHQINSNYIFQLPFGRGRQFGSKAGRVENAFIGGWDLSGLVRWTSGYPTSVGNGRAWATNWELSGFATQTGPLPETGTFMVNGLPSLFKDPSTALNSFRQDFAGEIGQRNTVRGPGYVGIDMGLGKTFKIAESQELRFTWETFNVFNSVRFDALTSNTSVDQRTTFGTYTKLLTVPRKMQFAVRYTF